MNKKIISLAITIVLILCGALLTVSTCFAASSKGISASTEAVEREGNFVVIFTIGEQTKNVSDLSLKFTFNNSAFELVDYTIPEITGAEKSVADTQKANHIAACNTNGSVAFGYNSADGKASILLKEAYATFTFKAKANAAFGSYSFTVADYDINSLDTSGLPGAVCNISSLTEAEKTVNVEVAAQTASEASVKLNKNTLTLDAGKTETLVAIVSNGKTVTWESDNESVATVDANGKVTAVKRGIATITATSGDKKDTCLVTVNCVHSFVKNADAQYLLSAANCQSAAVYYKSCSKCGERDTASFKDGDKDPSNHIDSSEWEQDDNEHWKVCGAAECGAIFEKAAHTASDWIVDQEATESEAGSKHKECTVCGRVLETTEIEKGSSNSDSDSDTGSDTDSDTGSDTGSSGNIVLWIVIAFVIIAGGTIAAIVIVRKKGVNSVNRDGSN